MAIDKRAVNAEREMKIAQTLDTPEGRTALAQAMVEPIRRALRPPWMLAMKRCATIS